MMAAMTSPTMGSEMGKPAITLIIPRTTARDVSASTRAWCPTLRYCTAYGHMALLAGRDK